MAGGWLKAPLALAGQKIWIAGHAGMAGSALARRLRDEDCEILTVSRRELDLRRQQQTEDWLRVHRPDIAVIAAATVGGIMANAARPAEFLHDNLMIAANAIEAAHRAGVGRLLFLGSACIYPREAPVPTPPEALMSGAPEPTNEAYALAKIAGVKLCQAYRRQYGRAYISAMPCNLYGPGDTYDADASHVIPALMMKAHAAARAGAQSLTAWGTGAPRREFLHVDDLADALVFLLRHYDGEAPVNIGAGEEVSIADLAAMIARAAGFSGRIDFDPSKPDGAPRRLLDSSAIRAAGWCPRRELAAGLVEVYGDFMAREIRKNAA